jgi:hypothetical protein
MRSLNHPQARRGMPRLWIVETLVVVGVLAFGYLAMTQDAPAQRASDGAFIELVR